MDGDGGELVLRGEVLGAGVVYEGGEVRVASDGTIACVGCDCSDGAPARIVRCPGSVIAPGFVNAHDHVAYAADPPRPPSPERYEHRHDWRLGLRGHEAIPYSGGASSVARAAQELRMLMSGVTTLAGGAGHVGLVRNPDVAGLDEGLPTAPADSDTFPLDDARGTLLSSGCGYGSGHATRSDAERAGSYLAHLGEGIDEAAENELLCAFEPAFGLMGERTGVVHAVGIGADLAERLAAERALVVWSPRSNLSLYGNTAPVTLLAQRGVELSLGTDWLLSGSMNIARELFCARDFSARYLDGYFDDRALFAMVTTAGARAVGAEHALGRLAPGYLADIVVLAARGQAPFTAAVTALPGDVALVLRGGVPLYGQADLVETLAGEACEPLDVCGEPKRVCAGDAHLTLAELLESASATYPLFSCENPPNEPTCTPSRPGEYDGTLTPDDTDGDGVPNDRDVCPRVFDPPRPLDGGAQADADGDGIGDACDPCPLENEATCDDDRSEDRDGDGLPNARDRCPRDADPTNLDSDGDGVGDACERCASPNPGVVPCPLPIAAVRDAADAEHPRRHALVRVTGEVTALRPDTGSSRGFYVQGPDAAYSGLFVYTGSTSPGLVRGDRVSVRGRYDVYYDTDELVAPVVVALESGAPSILPVDVVPSAIGDGGELAAPLDAMLVRVLGVRVESENPDAPSDYDELLLEGGLRVDDLLYQDFDNVFPAGTTFLAITGILGRSFGHEKIFVREASDLEP